VVASRALTISPFPQSPTYQAEGCSPHPPWLRNDQHISSDLTLEVILTYFVELVELRNEYETDVLSSDSSWR
jgi:hypothetical protein